MVLLDVTGFPSARRSRAGHTWSRPETLGLRVADVKREDLPRARPRFIRQRRQACFDAQTPPDPNVSHSFGSPLVSPRRSHSTRFADDPCVQVSGTV